jgi:predicted aspartyl protease
MKIPYLSEYTPAVPVLQIWLGYPEEALRLGPLEAVVDTGADATILPRSLVDALEAPFVDDAWLSSQWGEWFTVKTFTVDIGFGNFRLPAIRVVPDERSDEIILGRNVLNRLRLLLDGPAQETQLLEQ